MVGIVTEPIDPIRRLHEEGTAAVPATFGQSLRAGAEGAWITNPVASATRWLERQRYYGYTDELAIEREPAEQAPFLAPDEANRRYGIPGRLTFDSDIPEPVAREMHELKREEMLRQDIQERGPHGVAMVTAQFLTGLLVSAADPLNVASAFVPAVGPARYAMWLARASSAGGRAAIRAGVGAAEGALGSALVEPIVYGVARSEKSDYGAVDSLLNVAFGTILGGGLHIGGGLIHDRVTGAYRIPETDVAPPIPNAVAQAPVETREALLRASVATTIERRPLPRELPDAVLARFTSRDVLEAEADLIDVAGRRRGTDAESAIAQRGEGGLQITEARQAETAPLMPDAAAREPETLRADLDAARAESASPADQVTAERLQSIDRDLAQPGLSPARRAELEGERRQIERVQRAEPARRAEQGRGQKVEAGDRGAEDAAMRTLRTLASRLGVEVGEPELRALAEPVLRAEPGTARREARAAIDSLVDRTRVDVVPSRPGPEEIAAQDASRAADQAVQEAKAVAADSKRMADRQNAELQDAEANVARLREAGMIDASDPELREADEIAAAFEARARAYEAGGFCLARNA